MGLGPAATDYGATAQNFWAYSAHNTPTSSATHRKILELTYTDVVVNADNDDVDFIIEDDTGVLFQTDADNRRVGIGTATPEKLLSLYGESLGGAMLLENSGIAGPTLFMRGANEVSYSDQRYLQGQHKVR